MRRYGFIFSLIALLLLPAVNRAQDTGEIIAPVYAQGSGMIALNGVGNISLTGKGVLFIVDRSGTASIDLVGEGRRKEQSSRGSMVISYYRFDGTVTISGDNIAMVMDGDTSEFMADVDGHLFFKGVGDYSSEDNTNQEWTASGVTLSAFSYDPGAH